MSTKNIVIQIRKENPLMKASKIARMAGVSHERVRQILKNANLCIRLPPKIYVCNHCGKKFSTNRQSPKFCSKECWQSYHRVTLNCEYCHKIFFRRQSELLGSLRYNSETKKFFCSKICQGKYAAQHYGFIVHPENIGSRKKKDHRLIYQLKKDGFSYREISQLTNVNINTLYVILCRLKKNKVSV